MREQKHKDEPSSYLFFDFVKITAALPGLLFFRPKILYESGEAKRKITGGALLIANHFGFFDPIYLQVAVWYRRMHFVCLQQFFDSRAGWLFRAVHCIPVDRENIGMDSIRRIVTCLKEGKLVGMFPEGHIVTEGEELAAFKSGMVLMAMQAQKPIIPVYIRPRLHWYDRLVLVIGERVTVDQKNGLSSIERTAEMLREKEEALKDIVGGRKA